MTKQEFWMCCIEEYRVETHSFVKKPIKHKTLSARNQCPISAGLTCNQYNLTLLGLKNTQIQKNYPFPHILKHFEFWKKINFANV